MQFFRARSELSLSDAHVVTALASMSSQPNPHRPAQLGVIARRLFQGPVADGVILRRKPAMDVYPDHGPDREDNTYVAQPNGASSNRHGLEGSAIHNARRLVNFPNDDIEKTKGMNGNNELYCWRCNSVGRIATNCHLQSKPALAFGEEG